MIEPGVVDTELRARFRALGASGLFAALAEPATLEAGCRRLAALAHDADELGVFLSVIAAAGLAIPLFARGGDAARALADEAIAGRAVLAVAITEEGSGSDVLGMRTTLSRSPSGGLVLEGGKWHITNAPCADAVVVFAMDRTTDDRFLTAIVVRPTDRGVSLGPPLDLIGCHGSPTGSIRLDHVEVTADRVVGESHDGQSLLELAFVRERVIAPWPLLGKMERVLEECLDHVEARVQFGKAIHEFQYVQEKVVASFDALDHARLLAARATRLAARGTPSAAYASLAKAAAADAAALVFRAAIEVHGAQGIQVARRYGAYLADALCAQIAGGTRETHKKVVFGELRRDRARMRRGGSSRLVRTAAADG